MKVKLVLLKPPKLVHERFSYLIFKNDGLDHVNIKIFGATRIILILKDLIDVQRLNFGMKIECCCCEQPISNQKIILTAISLGAHNNNIRIPSHNSASVNDAAFRTCWTRR